MISFFFNLFSWLSELPYVTKKCVSTIQDIHANLGNSGYFGTLPVWTSQKWTKYVCTLATS